MNRLLQDTLELNDVSLSDIDVNDKTLSQVMTDITVALDYQKYEDLLSKVIYSDRRISIFPDYDCDGVCSGSVLYQGLKILGVDESRLNLIIPSRNIGYGFQSRYFDKLQDTTVLMTTDNGVNSSRLFNELMLSKDFIILGTDHHIQEGDLLNSDNYAMIDPNRKDDPTKFKGMSGTCVIWKMLLKQAEIMNDKDKLKGILKLLDLVGLSTISDVMPLIKENRKYVSLGVKFMNKFSGWTAFKDKLGHDITDHDLGWTIAPAINSDSRINGCPKIAFSMMLSEKEEDKQRYANELLEINEQRKKAINQLMDDPKNLEVNGQVGLLYPEKISIELNGKQINSKSASYAGLIASRLVGKTQRPSIVVTKGEDGRCHGSARSIGKFDLVSETHNSDFEKYGFQLHGHAGAAGVSFPFSNYWDIVNQFNKLVWKDTDQKIFSKGINRYLDIHDVTFDDFKELLSMHPFGNRWEFPQFIIKDFILQDNDYYMIGKKNNILKGFYKVNENEPRIEIIDFDYQNRKIDPFKKYDLIGDMSINHWNGVDRLQFKIIDFLEKDMND